MVRRVVRLAMVLAMAGTAAGCNWWAHIRLTDGAGNSEVGREVEDVVLSHDGRYVAYVLFGEAVRYDLATGTTEPVAVSHLGVPSAVPADRLGISADGRYVVFTSTDNGLVPGDGSGLDVFVRDVVDGTTERVSVDENGGDLGGGGENDNPVLSANGRFVVWEGDTDELGGGTPLGSSTFVRDRELGTTELVSVVDGDGEQAFTAPLGVSDDGRYVLFMTDEALDPADTNGGFDGYVRDRQTGTDTWIGVRSGPGSPDDDAADTIAEALTPDGRHVLFFSEAGNLVPGDGNGTLDVFVRDLVLGTTTRASVAVGGGDADGPSEPDSISADGRYVAFSSEASNLVAVDGVDTGDLFVRDLAAGETVVLRSSGEGTTDGTDARDVALSGDGHVAAVTTDEPVDPSDTNGAYDLYVRHVWQPRVTSAAPTVLEPGTTTDVTFTGDHLLDGLLADTAIAVGDGGTNADGTNVVSVTVVSSTEIVVAITVAADAPPGPRILLLAQPGPAPGFVPATAGGCGGCFEVGTG